MNFGDQNSRKYTCFVCGVQFTTPDEFKDHILENHEKDKEYVLCPLPHCSFPVRDIRAHFKAKHPNFEIPKKGMLKAMVWKDIKANGKLKARKPTFRQGYYQSTKMQKTFKYRSGYEATVYECLDQISEVLGYAVEPIHIPYILNGEQKTYIPDLVLTFHEQGETRQEIWEIKPSNQTALEQNKAKWAAADLYAKSRGIQFKVITEIEIEKLKKKARQYNI